MLNVLVSFSKAIDHSRHIKYGRAYGRSKSRGLIKTIFIYKTCVPDLCAQLHDIRCTVVASGGVIAVGYIVPVSYDYEFSYLLESGRFLGKLIYVRRLD